MGINRSIHVFIVLFTIGCFLDLFYLRFIFFILTCGRFLSREELLLFIVERFYSCFHRSIHVWMFPFMFSSIGMKNYIPRDVYSFLGLDFFILICGRFLSREELCPSHGGKS